MKKNAGVGGWRQFRSRWLPRLLLDEAAAPGDTAPNCAAAVLAERLQVPLSPKSTPQKVVDAWLCRTLGLATFSLEELRNTLLAKELGMPKRRQARQTQAIGVATLAGAKSGKPDDVLVALTTRWLLEDAPSHSLVQPDKDAPFEPTLRPPAREGEFAPFVRRVREATDGPDVRGHGDNKVFIGSVWQALESDPEIGRLGEEEFKRRLVEAHRRGALVLARADLVSAMDPRDVRASETRHQNATYHFIQRGQPA